MAYVLKEGANGWTLRLVNLKTRKARDYRPLCSLWMRLSELFYGSTYSVVELTDEVGDVFWNNANPSDYLTVIE